ncbi:MAG: N-acetylmuramoyl-L-alanine amidase [Crocinitomicaceae bacterium]|nr:N-acetylmuramoyl-L-alanine amidase [Crocinitomicaceae bacterium]
MKWFFIIFLLAYGSSTQIALAGNGQVVLVLDAGHGGNDPGHESTFRGHLDEKALNLKITTLLGGYINKYLQNVKVVYTRTGDQNVSLNQRVDKANSINANYFISIHCNGNDRSSIRGTESHVHSMKATKAVSFARLIERQFAKRAGRHSRGVKDKNDLKHSLQVLKYTKMTSVLVECGFLTNKREASYLNSTYGQEIIASAIFRAFRSFIQKEHPSINFIKPKSGSSTASSGNYAIQIMSSKTPVDTKDSSFKKLKMDVTRKKLNTKSAYKYIYTVGTYASKSEAKKSLSSVQSRGFKDAIIIKK